MTKQMSGPLRCDGVTVGIVEQKEIEYAKFKTKSGKAAETGEYNAAGWREDSRGDNGRKNFNCQGRCDASC